MATSTNGSRIAGTPITRARRATGALGRAVGFARFEYCVGVPTTTRQYSFDPQIGTAISPVTGTTSLAEFALPGRCRAVDVTTELERIYRLPYVSSWLGFTVRATSAARPVYTTFRTFEPVTTGLPPTPDMFRASRERRVMTHLGHSGDYVVPHGRAENKWFPYTSQRSSSRLGLAAVADQRERRPEQGVVIGEHGLARFRVHVAVPFWNSMPLNRTRFAARRQGPRI